MDTCKYAPSESATSFSFSELCSRIKRELKEKYHKFTDEQIREIYPTVTDEQLEAKEYIVPEDVLHDMIYKNLKNFSLNNQIFEYISKRNYLGGHRWFVICPKCKKSCMKLFLPNKHKKKEQLYLCKECHGLKNASSILGATNKYKKVIKPLKKLEILKAKLLRRHMNPDKAQDLLLEYERIERELSVSSEYRLWKFQKEHSMSINRFP